MKEKLMVQIKIPKGYRRIKPRELCQKGDLIAYHGQNDYYEGYFDDEWTKVPAYYVGVAHPGCVIIRIKK